MSALRRKQEQARQASLNLSSSSGAVSQQDKENRAPSSSFAAASTRAAAGKALDRRGGAGITTKAPARIEAMDSDEDIAEEEDAIDAGGSQRKAAPKASTSQRKRVPSSSAPESTAVAHERKVSSSSGMGRSASTVKQEFEVPDHQQVDEWADGSLLERRWQDKAMRLEAERDQIQTELDELRELRHTEAEKQYADLKRASEARHKSAQDLIASLTQRLEQAEKRGGHSAHTAPISMTPEPTEDSLAITELERELERERAEAKKRERKLQDQVARLAHELEEEVATSKKLLGAQDRRTGSGSATSSRPHVSSVGLGDQEKAIRRLYEDLTGMVINSVEKDASNPNLKHFRGLFASEGFCNIEFGIEESTSPAESTDARGRTVSIEREDLVFVPQLDEDRDANILEDTRIPDHLKDPIRFGRSAATKFMSAFLKGYRS